MKILVTGGAGFIGSHICRLLLDEGHEVTVFDNLSKGSKSNIDKRASFVKGDLRSPKGLKNALKGVEAVIHMAALAEVNESVHKPLLYLENNVIGCLNLLEAMREVGVKRIIFSSSCTVYGRPEKLPLTEDAPISATNPYGATKVACEALITSYHHLYAFDTVLLRYFNPYGPGEKHNPETHAIPNFILSGLAKKPIPLFWKGEGIRDFIYVEDLARAHIAPLKLKGFHTFNVGSEQEVKVIGVVNLISKILGYKLEVKDLGERAGDVPATYASSKKLNKATGWTAEVSLEEGLRETIDWFKART